MPRRTLTSGSSQGQYSQQQHALTSLFALEPDPKVLNPVGPPYEEYVSVTIEHQKALPGQTKTASPRIIPIAKLGWRNVAPAEWAAHIKDLPSHVSVQMQTSYAKSARPSYPRVDAASYSRLAPNLLPPDCSILAYLDYSNIGRRGSHLLFPIVTGSQTGSIHGFDAAARRGKAGNGHSGQNPYRMYVLPFKEGEMLGYVEGLERRLETCENAGRLPASVRSAASANANNVYLLPHACSGDPSPNRNEGTSDPACLSPMSNPSVVMSNCSPESSSPSTMRTDTYINSSHIPTSRVREFLWKRTPVHPSDSITGSDNSSLPCTTRDLIKIWSHPQDTFLEAPSLPGRGDADHLLRCVNFYIGQTQHHFDVREVSDHLALFFDGCLSSSPIPKLWYIKLVLIFAVGKLVEGRFDDDTLPGDRYFKYAQALLPNLSKLLASKRHGVEVLGLLALYLQNVNSALRMAIAHGFHVHDRLKEYLQSEKTHLNRLWWTIYMQEKRLAAATGNPSSINRDTIELEMPTNALGFPSPFPICLNIRIAHITGRVLQKAARRMLSIVLMLKKENIIAIFGFFDLDATFSSAFIMILTAIFNIICKDEQAIITSPGLDEAIQVLRHLSHRGNPFAGEKLREVEHIWAQLHVDNNLNNGPLAGSNWAGVFPDTQESNHQQPSSVPSPRVLERSNGPQLQSPDLRPDQGSAVGHSQAYPASHRNSSGDSTGGGQASHHQGDLHNDGFDEFPIGDWLVQDTNEQYNAILGSQEWALTGQDSIDFAELATYLPGFGE
ncbi:hypothetical protein N7481_002653 [Penicillium waksmanii]|uniref:uncharacterized protein n=1 Tax=Penicillium waksmanii TaxID=69791 RepID=UPI0025489D74|nr:uncharacterized protein N7481_002653 [Penicillium waksmanii]KAJ5995676.1 hypothetical protein N7481_002653 [Penicillium waksmanii]